MEESNNKSKTIIIILIVALVCALGVIIYLLCFNKKDEPKKEERQEQEKQKDDEDDINQDEYKSSINWNGKEYTIRCKQENNKDITYINDKKVIEDYCGYVLKGMNDYLVAINSMPQYGSLMRFFDKDLNELSIDINYYYSSLSDSEDGTMVFENNKIKADFLTRDYEYSLNGIYMDNIYIEDNYEEEKGCPSGTKKISEYRNIVEKYKDKLLRGTIELDYNNGKITYNYLKKVTIWDEYGKAIENNSSAFCVTEIK